MAYYDAGPFDDGPGADVPSAAMRFRNSALFWPLLVLAALAVTGHLCVSDDLPVVAGALPAGGHADADGDAHEILHAASCYAVTPQSSVPVPVPGVCPSRIAFDTSVTVVSRAIQAPAPYASPPLFLLHAALLI